MLSVQPASNGSQSLVSDEASQCPAQCHHLRLLQQGNNDPAGFKYLDTVYLLLFTNWNDICFFFLTFFFSYNRLCLKELGLLPGAMPPSCGENSETSLLARHSFAGVYVDGACPSTRTPAAITIGSVGPASTVSWKIMGNREMRPSWSSRTSSVILVRSALPVKEPCRPLQQPRMRTVAQVEFWILHWNFELICLLNWTYFIKTRHRDWK